MIPLEATPMKSSTHQSTPTVASEASNGMIQLHNLKPSQTRHKYKRVGRGNSSGKGTTAGRGTKGQRARTGGRNKLTRRGMKHLVERTPKNRGFTSRSAKLRVVTLAQLQQAFSEGTIVTPAMMQQARLIPQTWPGVKVLKSGELKKKLTVQAHGFSAGAAEAITKAGGTMSILPVAAPTSPKPSKPTDAPAAKRNRQ